MDKARLEHLFESKAKELPVSKVTACCYEQSREGLARIVPDDPSDILILRLCRKAGQSVTSELLFDDKSGNLPVFPHQFSIYLVLKQLVYVTSAPSRGHDVSLMIVLSERMLHFEK